MKRSFFPIRNLLLVFIERNKERERERKKRKRSKEKERERERGRKRERERGREEGEEAMSSCAMTSCLARRSGAMMMGRSTTLLASVGSFARVFSSAASSVKEVDLCVVGGTGVALDRHECTRFVAHFCRVPC